MTTSQFLAWTNQKGVYSDAVSVIELGEGERGFHARNDIEAGTESAPCAAMTQPCLRPVCTPSNRQTTSSCCCESCLKDLSFIAKDKLDAHTGQELLRVPLCLLLAKQGSQDKLVSSTLTSAQVRLLWDNWDIRQSCLHHA